MEARFKGPRAQFPSTKASHPVEDSAEHFPDLPTSGTLERTDRICSSALPSKTARGGIKRVFHEAGPVAYYDNGVAPLRCIHCGRDFSRAEITDKTLTGAA